MKIPEFFKPRCSALFNIYNDRLARVKNPDELLLLAEEINKLQLRPDEMLALRLGCLYAAKHFDHENKKLRKKIANDDFSLDCSDPS